MKNLYSRSLIVLCFLFTQILDAQTIVTIPVYPTDQDSTTVIFDASKGNAGLMNAGPPVYAHTGVITNLSAGGTDWKYVIADWSQNIPKALMTPLGNNKYQIVLKPSIRAFYGVPAAETIEKIAFVFRNADGSKVGKEADGGDIFGDVYTVEASVNILQPSQPPLFIRQGTPVPVVAVSPLADSLFLYQNRVLIKKVQGNTISDTILAENYGSDWQEYFVTVLAKNDTSSVADSFAYTVIPAPTIENLSSTMADGINYISDTSIILKLFAPFKSCCFVLGDFNNWKPCREGYMKMTPDSARYWIELTGLTPGQEYVYQYLVDGNLPIGDPYADKVSDPNDAEINAATYPGLIPYPTGKAEGIATVFQTAQTPFSWDTATFIPPSVTDLVIYEMLIRDFTTQHTYQSVIDTLDYLKNLGINAIELMPVMEFEGNSSWGYNPDYLFAPDKYYGPKDKLKALVETAHTKGIAVILDIVLNHQFGQSPLVKLYWDDVTNRPAANSPWFNQVPKHPYNVGNDFNHESSYTRSYCARVLKYWLSEYRVDGYRFDLSKGFTQKNSYPDNVGLWGQYDAARIDVLKYYNNIIKSQKPDAIVILEHFADNDEEKVLSSAGMLLWGNLNYNYNEATMGYNESGKSDFSWISYVKRGWNDPHVLGYMESHDEERLMYKNVTYGNTSQYWYNLQDTSLALNRMALAAAFFYTVPGPKMLWQFGELGYDYSINYPCGNDCRLSPKPVRWDYFDNWKRRYLYYTVAALINLKTTEDAFEHYENYTLNTSGALKSISIRSIYNNICVAGNFDVVEGSITPGWELPGTWYDYLSGDSITVTSLDMPLTLQAGEYHVYTSRKLPKPPFTGIGDPPGAGSGSDATRVFPNPTTGLIRIDARDKIAKKELFDLAGRKIGNFGSSNTEDLSSIRQGIYLLKIRFTDGRVDSVKVVRE